MASDRLSSLFTGEVPPQAAKGAFLAAYPLRLASQHTSPVNGGGKPPPIRQPHDSREQTRAPSGSLSCGRGGAFLGGGRRGLCEAVEGARRTGAGDSHCRSISLDVEADRRNRG